jgi:hypothetical protein
VEKYQDMVYRTPGPYSRQGGTYDTMGVSSRAAHDAALANGWFNTLPEAIAGKTSLVEVKENAPPTREELEQKARELGVKFSKNTKDEQLNELIEKALKG